MIVLFDPHPPFLRWCKVANDTISHSKCEFGPRWFDSVKDDIGNLNEVEAYGYLLYHGGEVITSPVSVMSLETLIKLEETVRFSPENNAITYKVAFDLMNKFPTIPHVLFCDTAFFAGLPNEASTYAIPYKLRRDGIRRYGGYGLGHEYAYCCVRDRLEQPPGNIISIYLGNHSNMTAVKDGKPLETTIGFTSVEGIPSSHSSGDIDPTIIFQLHFSGMSFDEINDILSYRSGFSGYLDKPCTYRDLMVDQKDAEKSQVKEMFQYTVIKHIGSMIATLNGVDAIVFQSPFLHESIDFINGICQNLEFLGLKSKVTPSENNHILEFTKENSSIKVFGLEYDMCAILAQRTKEALHQAGGIRKMVEEKRFLVDVGMKKLPFPMRVVSKTEPEGQYTIAYISVNARIMQQFEASWIDKFIMVLHAHRERIGTKTLRDNILDYLKELKASNVRIDFEYPFFIEKVTPVSKEKCLVQYNCYYSAKVSSIDETPKIIQKIEIPVVTTYPASAPDKPGGLFGQLSIVHIEIESKKDIFPEDLVEMVDKRALVPVYSFLTEEDQHYIIDKVHSEKKTSVVMTDEIKEDLARNRDIGWYSVQCANYGMLHSYSTVIGTEKSMWVPFTSYGEEG